MSDILRHDLEVPEVLVEKYQYIADPKQTPIRIDKFLIDRMEKVSRSKIQTAIKEGFILLNSKEVKSNAKIKPGDVIDVKMLKHGNELTEVVAENIPLDIRYEDDDIIVVYKPAGMVVHPGVGNFNGTLLNGLAYHVQANKVGKVEKNSIAECPRLAHRIDKDTTGLLVVGKTEEAILHLGNQFKAHTVKRSYYALVWGEPDEKEGTIDAYIGRHPSNRIKFSVYPEGDVGKHAITHYKIIEPMYYVSLLECRLETGRTHQIRVHMQHKGHPLFNDARYGGDRIMKGTVFSKYKQFVENNFKILPRQALHARSLGFVHPRTGEEVYFECDLPEDFIQCLDRWRAYVNTRKKAS